MWREQPVIGELLVESSGGWPWTSDPVDDPVFTQYESSKKHTG